MATCSTVAPLGGVTSPDQKPPYLGMPAVWHGGQTPVEAYVGIKQAYLGSFEWLVGRLVIPGSNKSSIICFVAVISHISFLYLCSVLKIHLYLHFFNSLLASIQVQQNNCTLTICRQTYNIIERPDAVDMSWPPLLPLPRQLYFFVWCSFLLH